MKTVILISKDGGTAVYKTLSAACRANDNFSYHYLKSKKFPFTYKGYTFIKSKIYGK